MKLLALTPTLGTSVWLSETLASVAALGTVARHVLVCPPAVAGRVRALAPDVEVLEEEAPGVYAALNRGLQAEGDWDAFTWINDDDVLVPANLLASAAWLAADPAYDATYGRVDYISARGANLGPLPVEADPARLRARFGAGLPGLTQHGTIVRRTLAKRLGPFDLRYRLAADFDYWARALVTGARFGHVAETVARYRLHAGQLSGNTAGTAQEIAASAARHFPGGSSPGTRLQFKLRHLPDLWRRWRLTGCLSSAALYRRAAQEDLMP